MEERYVARELVKGDFSGRKWVADSGLGILRAIPKDVYACHVEIYKRKDNEINFLWQQMVRMRDGRLIIINSKNEGRLVGEKLQEAREYFG